MRGVDPSLVFAAQDGMARDELPVFKNPNLMSMVLYLKNPFSRCVRHAVVIARDRDHAFMADAALNGQNSIVWDCW